jgi:hypothetical protein
MSYKEHNFYEATSSTCRLKTITHPTRTENVSHLWWHLLARHTNYLSLDSITVPLLMSFAKAYCTHLVGPFSCFSNPRYLGQPKLCHPSLTFITWQYWPPTFLSLHWLLPVAMAQTMTPPSGHVQQLPTQTTHLDVFSHVVECILLLQQDNIICQGLIDSWGDSNNLCMIYVLITVPLDTLTITYGTTSDAQPLSNAYKNWITPFYNIHF